MAILSCHVSIKLPPKISDGQGNMYMAVKPSSVLPAPARTTGHCYQRL